MTRRDLAAVPPCACGLAAPYESCCGRWHDGIERGMAPSALALMRSRYTAHVFGLEQYLLDTWHPRTRPFTLAPPPPGLTWIGLEVRCHGVVDDDHATVEFVARSKTGGRAERMHVTSRFERTDGRWFYVDDAD